MIWQEFLQFPLLLTRCANTVSDSKNASSKGLFLALPINDKCCIKVDTVKGLWAKCVCSDIVKSREGRPFTVARWNEHLVTKKHVDFLVKIAEKAQLIAMIKKNDP